MHEIAWGNEQLILTNTRFSCLCKLHSDYSFVPQWRPPFISALAPDDRCHLNGLALVNGIPKYVTVLGQTNTGGGWRQDKVSGGCLLDLPNGEVVAAGLAMPHSPRVVQERVWVLNSGLGELSLVDVTSGKVEPVVGLSGYPRGLAIAGRIAFVGLSKARETETFGNLPISDRFDALKCGVAVVDLQGGRQVGFLEFKSGVDEIFDVQLLQGYSHPLLLGPHASKEGHAPIWLVPSV